MSYLSLNRFQLGFEFSVAQVTHAATLHFWTSSFGAIECTATLNICVLLFAEDLSNGASSESPHASK